MIATGYNRCHVSTNEGGSIEEEVYVRNIVDQVDTNGTVFLGLTTGCARCHDHKYDPIRAKDYYQLFAFFNNIDGPPMDGNGAKWAPIMPVPTAQTSRGDPGRRRPDRRACDRPWSRRSPRSIAGDQSKTMETEAKAASRAEFVWIDDALPEGATPQGDGPWDFVGKPDHPVL